MAGGRGRGRGKGGGRGRGRPNNSGSKSSGGGGRRRGGGGSEALFIDGGFLSDWSFTPSPSRGKNPSSSNKSGSKSESLNRAKSASGSKTGSRLSGGNTIGFQYPSVDFKESSQLDSRFESNNEDSNLDDSLTFALVDSKESQIFAYVDQTPSLKSQDVAFTYDYSSGFTLGDCSHRGLGYSDELEETPSGDEASLTQNEEKENPLFNSLPSEQDMDAEERNSDEIGVAKHEESLAVMSTPKKNSGFLSIGGVKLYTQDISDEESDEDEGGESVDEGSSGSSETGSSESDGSEGTSDSGSDVDDDVVEDYLEGIGGPENILNSKWLVGHEFDNSDDDTSSSGYDNTVKKLGGIALQEASRDYGMKKAQSRQKHNPAVTGWYSSIDDCMLIKDPRKLSAKKKHVAHFPQSWPLGDQKSKGTKKKHRKEAIAVKHRERMLRRGLDLEQINLKLEEIVLDGVDIYSFQPLHARDCSQVRRLASIYRLQSGYHGSGKKRFVTVTRTQHTSMPSSSDRVRLEKLIGAGMEDADFSVVENSNIKSVSGDGKRSKKNGRRNTFTRSVELGQSAERKSSAKHHGRANENREKGKETYANQPVSFVSSGAMLSETVEVTTVDSMEMDSSSGQNNVVAGSASFGAFEVHTKGFGSKMMAKMGYVEGEGLGKDGQGIAKPIDVVKRPKSLGLGVEFSNTVDDPATSNLAASSKPVKTKSQRIEAFEKHTKRFGSLKKESKGFGSNGKDTKGFGSYGKEAKGFGSFEKHTKGFGSKMMAKMGFVEGMGLGRDSQGIVNPLVAVRLPKSRGIGAKD
ncbi:uncharacterized protein LOC133782868 isoform X2 [Humulus lupulus]|uniref:uncharacterized protein LOC133782868 isoform X2 n=1 Tax=Humulus lupulus TaxID=3486 RepID=UPI002B4046D7|nr:uncharacterized protein LOC133782868 isoform X2 [Humulus lupulus]